MSAEKFLEVARQQIGYLGKASNSQLDSFTANTNGKYTKYGAWFGINPADFCDMFVSWCANQAGEGDAVGKFAYVPSHINWFISKGQFFLRGTRTPKAGDIIFFEYYTDGVVDGDHVGIVESCDGSYVKTIEGNTRNSEGLRGVFPHTYSVNDSSIYGYGRPNFSGSSDKKTVKVYSPWKSYQNGSTEEIVYKDTDLTVPTGSLNPYEKCYCTGRYGPAYAVLYKMDGSEDTWAVGYVSYNGGINE